MELSGLIFVALAVAWAVYLIPKALQHHDEHHRSRPVDRFSDRLRVLARREAISPKKAAFVVNSVRSKVAETRANAEAAVAAETEALASGTVVTASVETPAATEPPARPTVSPVVRRARIRQATKRRQRVLAALLLLGVIVATCAAFNVFSWWYAAAPATLLVAWLVLCRVMVRSERGLTSSRLSSRPSSPASPSRWSSPRAQRAESRPPEPTTNIEVDLLEDTASHPAIQAELLDEPRDPNMWDPVPVQLPTYVGKATAHRTVRTIDIDDTGVWSSGRSEADSALAREADDAERARKAEDTEGDSHRAVGS